MEPTGEQVIQLLQPIGGHMPTTQQEYDALVFRLRRWDTFFVPWKYHERLEQ